MLKKKDFKKMLVWNSPNDKKERWVPYIFPNGNCLAVDSYFSVDDFLDGTAPNLVHWDHCSDIEKEVPVKDTRYMTRDEAMDFVVSDPNIRVRAKRGNWNLPNVFTYAEAKNMEWCYRKNGEYGPAYEFRVPK